MSPTTNEDAIPRLVSDLRNELLTVANRRKAALALARFGSPEAFAALKEALTAGSASLKAGIAEALGACPLPEARGVILDLANGADEAVARGAIRGLAARGDSQAAKDLERFLFDTATPESVRTEAALALGDISQPAALAILQRGLGEIQDETIGASILEGLGKRPFAETEQFLREYLASSAVPGEKKAIALEALSGAEGQVVPLLLQYLRDPDAKVRAASAWALISAEPSPEAGPQLVERLRQEASSEVRARLYQALGNQEGGDFTAVLEVLKGEPSGAARVAGLGLWAATCRSSGTPEMRAAFDSQAVPELENTALSSTLQESRLGAVQALERAGTPGARMALQKISQSAANTVVIEAAQAALRRGVQPDPR